MPRALLASFAKRLAMPDLRWSQDEGFMPSRMGIKLLSGLTISRALVPEAVALAVPEAVAVAVAFVAGEPEGIQPSNRV